MLNEHHRSLAIREAKIRLQPLAVIDRATESDDAADTATDGDRRSHIVAAGQEDGPRARVQRLLNRRSGIRPPARVGSKVVHVRP